MNRIKANERRRKKEERKKERKKKNIVEPKNAAVPEGDDLFCLFSLSLSGCCCCHCRQEGRRIGRSFIPHLVHYSFLPLHGQTTFREKGAISFSSMARSTFGPIIIALLLLLSHHHVRYSLFRGREKIKERKKLDLTCSPFFLFFPRKPSNFI